MTELFAEYRTIIIFLHVISAVIWVGGMIAIRFAAHDTLATLEPSQRAHTLKNLFMLVAPFVIILLFTALIMAIALDLHHSDMKMLVIIKEAIWMVMALNLGAMILRRNKARHAIDAGDNAKAKALLGLIAKVMVPVNIALGIAAIFLGVMLNH